MAWTSFFRDILRAKVFIYADFMDPFCYIGFHNLQAAARSFPVELEWRGFELNVDTPPSGYRLESGANSDLRPGMWASVKGYAERAGLSFPEPLLVPNTHRAHQIVYNAQNRDVKIPLIERIFRAYFNEQKDIGDSQVLASLAAEFGRNSQGERGATGGNKAIKRAREEAQQKEFPGLPGFIYKGQTYFGALSQAFWQELFKPSADPKTVIAQTP